MVDMAIVKWLINYLISGGYHSVGNDYCAGSALQDANDEAQFSELKADSLR